MMNTEKRKANVGERILITNPELAGGKYGTGDVLIVVKTQGNTVVTKENTRWVMHSEYEVIVEQPKKSARITALESQVAELQEKVEALESAGKYPLTTKFERESAEVDAIMTDIKRKAKPTLESILATYPAVKPTPNEQRADVIKRAKAFVAKYEGIIESDGIIRIEFVVNPDKRTVVAIVHGLLTKKVRRRAVAKCDPDDVFNESIGKAIALARALGVGTPEEFVKAVQPTASVGQRVKLKHCGFATVKSVDISEVNSQVARGIAWISDDTDAVYE